MYIGLIYHMKKAFSIPFWGKNQLKIEKSRIYQGWSVNSKEVVPALYHVSGSNAYT